jgi:DNA-binding SARP family transcriptional activator/tetratricopeptide (TPR) repeat protein
MELARASSGSGSVAAVPSAVRIRLLGGFQVLLCRPPVAAGRLSMTARARQVQAEDTVCVAVPAEVWRRRQAAALVKLLALAPDRRLHREQVLGALWPGLPVDEAAPRLHKATHYARRALGGPDAILLRGDTFALCPDWDVTVDARAFRDLAERALREDGEPERPAVHPAGAATAADAYGGPLLPDDLYEQWTQDERDRLRLLYTRLLRAAGRWEELLAEDPADEEAHLALIRGQVDRGERHAALRQYERMDRSLRRELGVGPSQESLALRAEILAHPPDVPGRVQPVQPDDGLVGRDGELRLLAEILARSAARGVEPQPAGGGLAGEASAVVVSGVAGVGKSALLAAVARRAAAAGWWVGLGAAAPIEGGWPYGPLLEAFGDLFRRHPSLLEDLNEDCRAGVERAMSSRDLSWAGTGGHQQVFVSAAQLLREAAEGGRRAAPGRAGALLVVDDLHGADDASGRLLHYLARSMAGLPVVLLLAHRTPPAGGALAPAFAAVRESLLSHGIAVSVELGPLDETATAALVARRLRAAPGRPPLPGPEPVAAALVERIWQVSQGLPFTALELARRAAAEPGNPFSVDAAAIDGLSPAARDLLRRLAVVGWSFETDELMALAGCQASDVCALLDDLLDRAALERTDSGFRFRHHLVRDALLADLPPYRLRAIHREIAERLAVLGAAPARIGHHFVQAGERTSAVPYALRAAETEAALGAYRDALALVDGVRAEATGSERARLFALRADLLAVLADPDAPGAYRAAIGLAAPDESRELRARLARALLMAGDLDGAAAALDGLEQGGGPADASISLTLGLLAYFAGDLDRAAAIAQDARRRIVAAETDRTVCDLVALVGLVAHDRGEFFAQLTAELRRTSQLPALAATVFDAHLCIAQYLLYGSTPYAEVVRLADQLRDAAETAGAARAVAFAECLAGEALLLAGDLELAQRRLTRAVARHRDVASAAGEAHALQRLAQVRLALGDGVEANRLLLRALPMARWSPIAAHLVQRIYGTMVAAAPDTAAAYAVVTQAQDALGVDDGCLFCAVAFAVPATIVSAQAGDLDRARRHLAAARRSAALWEGTAWQAATQEAEAWLAQAEGDQARAHELLTAAGRLFDYAGHPSDAARCRAAAGPAAVPLLGTVR